MKLVVAEKFTTEALVQLKTCGHFDVHKLLQKSDLDSHLPDVEVLIIRSQTKITAELLEKAPQLKCIITSTSGFDHIDLKATATKNIQVMYTPEANTISAAELTWGLVLNTRRMISESQKNLRSGLWDREKFQGHELHGQNYGIIGLGRIGQKIAGFAKAFGMNVFAFDPYQSDEAFQKLNLQRSSYEEVLKQCDVISYHVPLTFETRRMLNRSHFEFLNRKAIVINTSRGQVIQEDDLVEALEKDWISGAALDVYDKEPLPRDSKLLKAPRLLLTQHIGAMTEEAFNKASAEAAQSAIDFALKNKLKNTLPLVNDWGKFSFEKENA